MTASLRRGSFWALLGKVVSSVSTMLTLALLTRLLSKADFGNYASLTNIMVLLAAIGGWGVTTSVVREVASADTSHEQGQRIQVALQVTVLVSGLVGLLACAGLLVGQHFGLFGKFAPGQWAILCLWAVFMCLQGTIGEAYRGLNLVGPATLFTGLLGTLMALAGLTILYVTSGVASLTLILQVMALCGFLASAAGLLALRRTGRHFLPSPLAVSPTLVRHFFILSTPFVGVNVLNYLLTQADVLLLTALAAREDVALYSVAARLVLFVLAPLVISNAVLPAPVARLYREGKRDELERLVRRVSTLAALPACGALLLLILGGPNLLEWFYGPGYGAAYPTLVILSLGQLALVLAGSGTLVLAMTEHQNEILKINAVMVAALGITGVVAIRAFGVEGMAATMALVWSISQVLTVWRTRQLVGIWPHVSVMLLVEWLSEWRDKFAQRKEPL